LRFRRGAFREGTATSGRHFANSDALSRRDRGYVLPIFIDRGAPLRNALSVALLERAGRPQPVGADVRVGNANSDLSVRN
jgi:hypothetical protein